jgi:hypothetical protein
MPDRPYSRAEMRWIKGGAPGRGQVCAECALHVPEFEELTETSRLELLKLIDKGERLRAMRRLLELTGCPLDWAKVWVHHSGRAKTEDTSHPPCPFCGEPLRTPRARQCRHCGQDWHLTTTAG